MFRRRESEPDPAPPAPQPKRRFTDAYETMDTVIGPQVRLQGDLKGATNLEIRGRFEGTAEIEGLVVLRKDGRYRGQLKTTSAVLEGTMEGTIEATEKVELGATAQVTADIRARSVAIAEGSYFQGKVHMGDSQRNTGSQHSFEERRSN